VNTTYELITDYNKFLALKDQWNDLVSDCASTHACFRHEWFESWLKYLAPVNDLVFFVARQGPDLIAAAPMQVVSTKLKGLPVRSLVFAGSSITPRNLILLSEGTDPAGFFRFLMSSSKYSLLLAGQVETDAPATQALIQYLTSDHGGGCVVEPNRMSPFLVTEGPW